MSEEHRSRSLDSLRDELRNAKGNVAAEMIALMRLFQHPEVTLRDLIGGLACSPVVAETPALILHRLLQIPLGLFSAKIRRTNHDPAFWLGIIRGRHLDLDKKAAELVKPGMAGVADGLELVGDQKNRKEIRAEE